MRYNCERCRLLRGAVDINSSNAFTLAEVLITLGIIGIVAALTLPSLIENHKDKQTVTALKKFYTVLEQAIRMTQLDNEENFEASDIMKQFKTTRICYEMDKSCTSTEYKYLNGNKNDNWGSKDIWSTAYAQLADGMIVRYSSNSNCAGIRGTTEALKHVCGEFSVDINGNKLPNTTGKDVFFFNITKYGVVPFGTEDENIYKFSTTCSSKNTTGYGCAAWVLINENLNYLYCDDLDWENKTSCK